LILARKNSFLKHELWSSGIKSPEAPKMDLSKLTDQQLMLNSKALVKQESTLLVTILHNIKEIDRRRLFADFKQPSLLDLVMHELGYPRDQALRRIQAMRMLREIPQVELMIESGELNLTHVGIVQSLFSHQKREGKALDLGEKITVLRKVAGQSTREAQRIVFALADTPLKFKESIKMVGEDSFEVTFTAKAATIQNLEKLKGILAHTYPGITLDQLIHKLTELGLETFSSAKAANSVVSPRPDSKAQIKRQIWQRDKSLCTNCGSTFAVEEDHRWPKAKGGQYTLENMRLLCRSCNQRAAVRHFGADKMVAHFKTE
jgi:hypothetical protein